MSVYQRAYEERDGSVFADYGKIRIEFREASHRYWMHAEGARMPIISVTSALRVLDKPMLLAWAERCGAEGAARLAQLGELKNVDPAEAVSVVRLHKLGMDAKRDAGAERGTALHLALEQYMSDGQVPNVADFTPETRGYVQGLCSWLLKAKPEPTGIEQLVGSLEHLYAGRVDLRANVDGRDVIVDLKTSPTARVYPEAHLQVAAYSAAMEECGLGTPDGAMVLAVGADGTFAPAECCATLADWLTVLRCYRTMSMLRALVAEDRKRREAAAE